MRLTGLRLVVLLFVLAAPVAGQISRGTVKHEGHGNEAPGDPSLTFTPTAALGPVPCRNGFADAYPCNNVDLESFMPLSDLGTDPGERAAGIWGWTDPETRKEYALVALRNRVSFVDVTDPKNPRLVGDLPGQATQTPNREVNVYGNFALVVADGGGPNGIQVFDLTRLRGTSGPPVHFMDSGRFVAETGRIHNIAVNAESGFAYAVGGRCGGGLDMFDLHQLPNLTPVNCWADPVLNYIHDTQCVIYRGPDKRFTGREICFASAVDALLIVDVTDKSAPQKISRTSYAGYGFVHQGWLTEDQKYFLMDDELDELDDLGNTRTYLWNLSDLTAPRMFATYEHRTQAIDHNQYVRGNKVYQSNYRAGLHILDISRIAEGKLQEIGFFDIVPNTDAAGFDGAWGNYPFFPSGTVVVGGIGQGLYILKPTTAPEPRSCKPGPDRLCFQGNRFIVDAGWRNPTTGATGKGTVLKRGPNYGIFTFDSGHADLIVRMTKTGQEFRLLYGQLTNLQISIGVTDTRPRGTTRFTNGPNNCGAVQPVPAKLAEGITAEDGLLMPQAFDLGKPGDGIPGRLDLTSEAFTFTDSHETGTCKAGPTRLCLHDKRFQAELTWRDPGTGVTGTARATKITDDSGTFAFKAANGVDVAVKTVETDRVRIVWGSLTSLEFNLKITDTLSGQVKTYTNPAGTFCGGVDSEGF
ncbi:MAG TPA: choice-of-anchor B family protein [Thermoanaerobaculia bacterium]|jgi:choice-of-anchor B domain-containing protein|nr:choice-of-anchor B family protein [Thermoanaerobaculia bacterium]